MRRGAGGWLEEHASRKRATTLAEPPGGGYTGGTGRTQGARTLARGPGARAPCAADQSCQLSAKADNSGASPVKICDTKVMRTCR